MNKKLVSLALATSLVAGSMSLGFAAGDLTANIEDAKVVKAVERLAAFGIVDGMDDGKYHPELEVTREQFAKVLVEALGLGSAAEAAIGGTQFADVEAGRWSAGYVNVAVGQGILKGYPDGTFKPANKVTYAEAVTMLVRAIGYQDTFLPGTWPGNYVAKAAEEGITKDVVFSPSGFADRGSMAVMVDNTLDADVVKISEYGTLAGTEIKYSKSDITLLEEKLDIFKLEEAVVLSTPKVDKAIDEDQMKVEIGKDYNVKSIDVEDGDEETYDVLDSVDTSALLGLSLNVYINDDKEVVYVEESDKPFKVLYDVVDEDEDIDEDDGMTFIKADKEYELEDDYTIYLDNKEVTKFSDFKDEAEKGNLFVKAVLSNKGNIKVIDAYSWDKTSGVVKEASASSITYFVDDADDEDTFKAKDYDKVVVMDNTGKMMKLEDIQKNDVIYINNEDMDGDNLEEAASGDEVAYVVVVRSTVEGDVDRYNVAKMEVRIDGTTYDVTSEATVSSNDGKDVALFDSGDGEDALNDITGDDEKALVIFDAKGYVRHITTDAEASSSDLYGVVTAKDESFGDVSVKILTNKEEVVTYEFDADDEDFMGGYTEEDDVQKGDVVKYTLDKDGEIDSIQKIAEYDATDILKVADADDDFEPLAGELTDDFTDDSMEVDNKDYNVASNVLVFDYTEGLKSDNSIDDLKDVEVVDFASLEDKGDGDDVVFFVDDNDEVQLIVLVAQIKSDDERAAYVLDKWTKDGDPFVELVEFDKDGKADYEIDGGKVSDAETIVVFTENTDGTIDVSSVTDGKSEEGDFMFYTGTVSDISGKYIEVEDKDGNEIETFKADADVVVYETDDEKDFSDIDEDDMITAVVKDGKAVVIKIYDEDDSNDMDLYDEAYDAHNDGGTVEPPVEEADVTIAKGAETSVGNFTFFAITATFENVDGAAEYEVTYTVLGEEKTTAKVAVGTATETAAFGTTVTVKVYDANGTLIETFANESL
ncbi:S-layer homology domain-containing protein [Peptoclostridium litorale DSM 5388]|uniref:Middle cell wall protein n=1 Tax=Peptoclostridium litorale DSM 5388 TaxID=1121324 RepID=A0A069RJ67_PEPLI|nr:S-layer homology domain-containing protein [Peptoclostridium litorale]KDR96170.1 middle cell wall protein [Peptoclostridium litorale DSM 5388]SIO12869.1 S-layer homology domain-containing protein [Peptoclostridium litorale DSM 5388]